jgi:hypothetical protein
MSLMGDNSGEFGAALAGAFLGAFIAYVLQCFHEHRKKRDADYASWLKAQCTLCEISEEGRLSCGIDVIRAFQCEKGQPNQEPRFFRAGRPVLSARRRAVAAWHFMPRSE